MKVAKETGKFLICYCPVHCDKNTPNFIINKCWHNGKPKGFSFCFSCGHHTEYSPEFVDSMSSKETKESKERIPVDWNNLTTRFLTTKLNTNNSYLYKLASDWKICVNTLYMYYVGVFEEGSDHSKAYTIPMRFADEQICGIQLRYPDGSKCCIEGSQLGLFIPYILMEDRHVVITEGFSDAAVATDCGFFGLGRPSAQAGNSLVLEFLSLNNITDVTIVADNDKNRIGLKSVTKLSELFEQNGLSVRIIAGELSNRKDLRQFFMINGREETIKLLKGIK